MNARWRYPVRQARQTQARTLLTKQQLCGGKLNHFSTSFETYLTRTFASVLNNKDQYEVQPIGLVVKDVTRPLFTNLDQSNS